ncbi:MAG: hypothetical protein Q9186_007405 [Xanthomendoza sp. 1 TL-2023]
MSFPTPSPTIPAPPPPPPLLLLNKRAPKTVTETITIQNSIYYVSFATEQHFLTLTDTVYINVTIFLTDTITHTRHSPPITHTSAATITATTTVAATAINACDSATISRPLTAPVGEEKLDGAAVAGIVIGSLVGVALLAALVWWGVRRWRAWKAKGSQRMRGVELQRRWETEQEMRVRGEDV